jgi:hypothetical protein
MGDGCGRLNKRRTVFVKQAGVNCETPPALRVAVARVAVQRPGMENELGSVRALK